MKEMAKDNCIFRFWNFQETGSLFFKEKIGLSFFDLKNALQDFKGKFYHSPKLCFSFQIFFYFHLHMPSIE